jgi:hypothetical protein
MRWVRNCLLLNNFSLIGSVSFLAVLNGFIIEDILQDSPTTGVRVKNVHAELQNSRQ